MQNDRNNPNTQGNQGSQSNQGHQGDQSGQDGKINPSTQGNKTRGSDIPGTSKDPTDRVISDQSPQEPVRQDPISDRGGSSVREPNSGSQKRS